MGHGIVTVLWLLTICSRRSVVSSTEVIWTKSLIEIDRSRRRFACDDRCLLQGCGWVVALGKMLVVELLSRRILVFGLTQLGAQIIHQTLGGGKLLTKRIDIVHAVLFPFALQTGARVSLVAVCTYVG